MRKIIYLGLLFFAIVACSENDNYDSPDETLQGAILDQETGDSIYSQTPNGLRVRLYDQNYDNPQPIDFWGMQDGSFKNTRLFPNEYKVIIDNGAFYPLDTMSIKIPLNSNLDVKVLPILRISAVSKIVGANSIVVEYKLSETKPEEGKIMRRSILVNSTPYVDINNFTNANPFINTENVSDSLLTNTTFRDTIKDLKTNTSYFVRVGARTGNVGNRYNYSQVMELIIP